MISRLEQLRKYFTDEKFRFSVNASHGLYRFMSDEKFLKKKFRLYMGYELDLENPQTFNEKMQYLKLHDRKPIYTTMVDKYEAKKYVSELIGERYVIPTYGVWNSFDEIDFDSLPQQFVLKCTHDSGGVVICKNKDTFDKVAAKKKINKCLRRNFYWVGREWPYKNVKPRILAEKYLEDKAGTLCDYKYYTFNEISKYLMINTDREIGKTKADYYDMTFQKIDMTWGYPHSEKEAEKPEGFEQMRRLAERLSKDTPELRVDFYVCENNIIFGEMTFYDGDGFERIHPSEWDKTLGDLVILPEKIGGGYVVINENAYLWMHQCNSVLTDYKFFCFGGHPQIMYVSQDTSSTPKTDFFDMEYHRLPITMKDPNSKIIPPCPQKFEEMKHLAERLSCGTKFLRVDFFNIDDEIYSGELTFFHCDGFVPVKPDDWNIKLGNWIDIK